jgi:hypothetical protein
MLFIRKYAVVAMFGVLLLLMGVGDCPAVPLQDAGNYLNIGRGVANVYFRAEDARVARDYLDWADAYRPRPTWLSASIMQSLSIYIAPSQEEFAVLSGGLLPEWGVACAIPGTDVVIVRSPRIVKLWREAPREILNHEITHIFLDQYLAGAKVPRWFHEGYALYASRMWDLESFLRFSVAILSGRMFPLHDLEKGMPENEEWAELAYIQSYTVVEFMFEYWDDAQMQLLFERWRATGDLDMALRSSVGLTLGRMEEKWRKWAGVRYGWLKLLTSATLMWIVAALLFLVVFARRRSRNKSKLDEMRRRESWLLESSMPARPPGGKAEETSKGGNGNDWDDKVI